nr:hypothetical protein [Tanacetum cinerariifolium]
FAAMAGVPAGILKTSGYLIVVSGAGRVFVVSCLVAELVHWHDSLTYVEAEVGTGIVGFWMCRPEPYELHLNWINETKEWKRCVLLALRLCLLANDGILEGHPVWVQGILCVFRRATMVGVPIMAVVDDEFEEPFSGTCFTAYNFYTISPILFTLKTTSTMRIMLNTKMFNFVDPFEFGVKLAVISFYLGLTSGIRKDMICSVEQSAQKLDGSASGPTKAANTNSHYPCDCPFYGLLFLKISVLILFQANNQILPVFLTHVTLAYRHSTFRFLSVIRLLEKAPLLESATNRQKQVASASGRW